MGPLNERQAMISECAERISGLIDNLTDVTRARFGASFPIILSAMDFGFVAHKMIDEIRAGHPSRDIKLDVSPGDLMGEWDKARIGQVFANLLSNVVQYGFKDLVVSSVPVKAGSTRGGLSQARQRACDFRSPCNRHRRPDRRRHGGGARTCTSNFRRVWRRRLGAVQGSLVRP